ncbi:hypothetical protein ACHAW6_013962 [Cyclotella cf. meneghiniana]
MDPYFFPESVVWIHVYCSFSLNTMTISKIGEIALRKMILPPKALRKPLIVALHAYSNVSTSIGMGHGTEESTYNTAFIMYWTGQMPKLNCIFLIKYSMKKIVPSGNASTMPWENIRPTTVCKKYWTLGVVNYLSTWISRC